MSNIRPTPPKSRATLSQIILFVFVLLQSLQMPTRINAKGLNIGWTCVHIRCAKSIVIVIFFYDPVIIFSAFINWFVTTDAFTHIHPPWFIYFYYFAAGRSATSHRILMTWSPFSLWQRTSRISLYFMVCSSCLSKGSPGFRRRISSSEFSNRSSCFFL